MEEPDKKNESVPTGEVFTGVGDAPDTAPPTPAGPEADERFGETEVSTGVETRDPAVTPTFGGGTEVALRPGMEFGQYELMEEIGQGGMGVVYRARQKSPQRMVAIKMIHAGQFAPSSFKARFEVEAQAVANLQHPNILPLYEAGEHLGIPYFTMPYIEGCTLLDSIKRQAWEPEKAVELLIKLTRAIAHAHRKNVLHRDLKPSNILVDNEGEPYVMDFGLAKVLGETDQELTRPGAVMGSPTYMSPEQAGGKTEQICEATDVYGLGTILYQLLCGKAPFSGESTAEVLQKVLFEGPARPGEHQPDVDPALEAICLKAMERNPEKRYQSAEELGQALDDWLSARRQAREFGSGSRAWKSPVAFLALAAVVLAVFLVNRSPEEAAKSPDAPPVASGPLNASFEFPVSTDWTASGIELTAGKIYSIDAEGSYLLEGGSVGIGAEGRLSVPYARQMGAHLPEEASAYPGGHPSHSLIGRFKGQEWTFYVGRRIRFVAPTDAELLFRINAGPEERIASGQTLNLAIREEAPEALGATNGVLRVSARVDTEDLLVITAEGVWWEHQTGGDRVGRHEGYYPTLLNGIAWWPAWESRARSEMLRSGRFWPGEGRAVVAIPEYGRGSCDVIEMNPDRIVVRFTDGGKSSATMQCRIEFR